MQNVHVVTVGLKEVGRTLSAQDAAKLMLGECEKLIDGSASPSMPGCCWIEGFLVADDKVDAALAPEYDLWQHRWVGVNLMDYVIANAHARGWMHKGKWVAQAP